MDIPSDFGHSDRTDWTPSPLELDSAFLVMSLSLLFSTLMDTAFSEVYN
jgi:hypothetical protein